MTEKFPKKAVVGHIVKSGVRTHILVDNGERLPVHENLHTRIAHKVPIIYAIKLEDTDGD